MESSRTSKVTAVNPEAFDAFAAAYDQDFTRSHLGRLLRPRVWARLAACFKAGDHVLELTCGTGEDAVWLARHGVRVTATDASAQMVRIAQAKAERHGVQDLVSVRQLSLQQLAQPQSPISDLCFDGAFSNFGGLNTIAEWPALAAGLAKRVKPGGTILLVPMGRLCPWEMGWYLLHGQPKTALRRLGRSASATVGGSTIPIWYPSARRLRTDFAPWFEHCRTESLGLALPPSYLEHLVARWPGLFERLNHLENKIAHLTKDWGDHYIITFRKKEMPSTAHNHYGHK